jgi:hypothetical protein
MKKLKNFLKQIEAEFDQPSPEEMEYINQEVKQYIVNGIIPTDKRAKRLAYQLTKGMKDMLENNTFPSMPHEQWMIENDTKCQPLDWKPSPDWKPKEAIEQEPEDNKPKLYLVKKGE